MQPLTISFFQKFIRFKWRNCFNRRLIGDSYSVSVLGRRENLRWLPALLGMCYFFMHKTKKDVLFFIFPWRDMSTSNTQVNEKKSKKLQSGENDDKLIAKQDCDNDKVPFFPGICRRCGSIEPLCSSWRVPQQRGPRFVKKKQRDKQPGEWPRPRPTTKGNFFTYFVMILNAP